MFSSGPNDGELAHHQPDSHKRHRNQPVQIFDRHDSESPIEVYRSSLHETVTHQSFCRSLSTLTLQEFEKKIYAVRVCAIRQV